MVFKIIINWLYKNLQVMKCRMIKYFVVAFIFISISCNYEKKVKIAFLLPHMKIERYVKEKEFFGKRIQELGGEYYFANAEYDQGLQLKQAKEFIENGVTVIVISPVNSMLAGEILRLGHNNNVTIISYDRMILNADVDYCITFRYQKVGEDMVKYCTQIKPQGKYVVLGGDKSDFNAMQINIGQQRILEPLVKNGSIKILYNSFIEEWNSENAYDSMESILRLSNEHPEVVISSGEKLTVGVTKALGEYNLLGKTLVTGMDPDKESCKRMQTGAQTISILKPIKKLAVSAADFAFSCATQKNMPEITETLNNGKFDIPTIFLDPIITDKNNVKSALINEGIYSEADFTN